MALGTQVINSIGLYLVNNTHQIRCVHKITVVQHQVFVVNVEILVDMIDAVGIE
jgi:hypothetical protein